MYLLGEGLSKVWFLKQMEENHRVEPASNGIELIFLTTDRKSERI